MRKMIIPTSYNKNSFAIVSWNKRKLVRIANVSLWERASIIKIFGTFDGETIWKKLLSSRNAEWKPRNLAIEPWFLVGRSLQVLRARVMGRGNNSSNLPTQFYWISSRQLLLAPFCRLPGLFLALAGLVAFHVSFARTLVATPQVCACKSQREVVTTGSPRGGWTRTLWPPGSPTHICRMRVRVHRGVQ